MPRHSNFPTLYNEALQINISRLKLWGYLKPNNWSAGTINWSRNEQPAGSISIGVSTLKFALEIQL